MKEKIRFNEEVLINEFTDIDENTLNIKLLEGEEDIKNNRVHSALEVFKVMREKFGY